jgi:hypothetical protein
LQSVLFIHRGLSYGRACPFSSLMNGRHRDPSSA